jgi:hypothetical protein
MSVNFSRVTSPTVNLPTQMDKATGPTGGGGKTDVKPLGRGELARAQLKDNMETAGTLFKGVGDSLKREVDVIRGTKQTSSGARASTTGEKVGAVGKLVGKTMAAAIMSPLLATGTVLLGVIGLADTACVAATRHRLDGRQTDHGVESEIRGKILYGNMGLT